jgi:hypothetical protein
MSPRGRLADVLFMASIQSFAKPKPKIGKGRPFRTVGAVFFDYAVSLRTPSNADYYFYSPFYFAFYASFHSSFYSSFTDVLIFIIMFFYIL